MSEAPKKSSSSSRRKDEKKEKSSSRSKSIKEDDKGKKDDKKSRSSQKSKSSSSGSKTKSDCHSSSKSSRDGEKKSSSKSSSSKEKEKDKSKSKSSSRSSKDKDRGGKDKKDNKKRDKDKKSSKDKDRKSSSKSGSSPKSKISESYGVHKREPPQPHPRSKPGDSTLENMHSPRVTFAEEYTDESSRYSSDPSASDVDSIDSIISGEISSGTGEFFSQSSEEQDIEEDEEQDQTNNVGTSLHGSVRQLPSVALKALQAMRNLKKAEPVALEAVQQKDDEEHGYARRASALHNSLSHDMGEASDKQQNQPEGLDWEKLNRKFIYKKIENERKVASEQTGKFFQVLQQQQNQEEVDEENSEEDEDSDYSDEEEPQEVRRKSIQSPRRAPRINPDGRMPRRNKSADDANNKSLSAVTGSARMRRQRSNESSNSLGSGSKGSKSSPISPTQNKINKHSGDSDDDYKKSPRRRAQRNGSSDDDGLKKSPSRHRSKREDQRESLHKSFSNYSDRPSSRRKKNQDLFNKKMNMSLGSGLANSGSGRSKSGEIDGDDDGGDTTKKKMQRRKSEGGRSRPDRKKREWGSFGGASAAHANIAEDHELNEDELAVENFDDEDFEFKPKEDGEFVSVMDLVKTNDGRRASFWD